MMRIEEVTPRRRADTQSLIAFLALFAGAAALAYGGVFVRQSELPPTASAFWRIALAIPVLAAAMRFLSASVPVEDEERGDALRQRFRLILVGMIFSGNLTLWHWSLTMTKLANANLLTNFAPLVVILGGWLLYRQRITANVSAGLVIALAGAVLLIAGKLEFTRSHVLGDLLSLATAVFYGAYLLALGRVRMRSGTMEVMLWSGVGTLIVLLPLCLAMGENLIPTTLHGLLILVGLALISHIAGQGLIAYAMAHLPAAVSSITLLSQPVFAALIAWVLLDERLTAMEILGGATVLAGVLIARHRS